MAASRKSTFIVEYCVEDTDLRNKLIKQDLNAVEGFIRVPEDPGIGIELNEEIVNRYRV